MGTHKNLLCEAVLMCTHNLCFEKKKKILMKFSFLQLKKSLYIAWECFCNEIENMVISYDISLIRSYLAG